MKLRDYQLKLENEIYANWQNIDNVLVVSPCGSGKSMLMTKILSDSKKPAIVIAHRAELVFQLSMTLARWGTRHNIIASATLIKAIIQSHITLYGKSYYNPQSHIHTSSVQTLINRDISKLKIGLWISDESHHCLENSVWGKCIAKMKGAKGAGFTATPCRSDGKGLGRDAHGLFDKIIEGSDTRELIDRGFLSDYKIYAPSTQLDLSAIPVGASGDYVQEQLRATVHKSRIVGDTVANYRRFAAGLRTIVFTVDIASADEIAAAFNGAGIAAESVNGKTDPTVRATALRKLETGELKVVANCELFGEGVDLPAVECVIFARPTESLGLFIQQFQRGMRKDPSNPDKISIVIDQVGNVARHGLPDSVRSWTLDARERRARTVERQTTRTCDSCLGVYLIVEHGSTCPYCQTKREVAGRAGPEVVDGDLAEMAPELLALLRGKAEAVFASPKIPYGATPVVVNSIKKHHMQHMHVIEDLKKVIAIWAIGRNEIARAQREFYQQFGIDVLSAQSLNLRDAENLLVLIRSEIDWEQHKQIY